MKDKIRVLVITHAPWRNDTSIGNSYSNIFYGMEDKIEFAQLYIRDGLPENEMVHTYFHISEKKLLKSVFTRKPVGEKIYLENPMDTPKVTFSNKYNLMRRLRWDIFLLGRDVASSLGNWRTKELDEFLAEFNPDIIFGTFIFTPIINQLMIYAKKRTNAVLIPYAWDDWYTINPYSHSIFYHIRIRYERYYLRKCAEESSYMYTITDQMKEEYEKTFNRKCKILKKGFDFSAEPIYSKENENEIKLIYTGNIGDERWKVLADIAKEIAVINRTHFLKMHQYIYTLSPVSKKMESMLNIPDASRLMGAISSSKVSAITNSADILIHVEPTSPKKLCNCRLSFSTKIVDYFSKAKCVLAVGGQNASMKYLKENDAAIVVDKMDELHTTLEKMVENPEVIKIYGHKAWKCGVRNHNIRKIQESIYSDFIDAL